MERILGTDCEAFCITLKENEGRKWVFFQLGILFILIYQHSLNIFSMLENVLKSPCLKNMFVYIFFILNFYFRNPFLLPEWYMTFFFISLLLLSFLTWFLVSSLILLLISEVKNRKKKKFWRQHASSVVNVLKILKY